MSFIGMGMNVYEILATCTEMNKEHKHTDKDEFKDNDKDKDAERKTESLSVCSIFGILTTQAF